MKCLNKYFSVNYTITKKNKNPLKGTLNNNKYNTSNKQNKLLHYKQQSVIKSTSSN